MTARDMKKDAMTAARRRERSSRSQAMMIQTAARRRDRSARSMATRAWIAAPISWRKMKSILSHRRRLDVAKAAKSRELRSHRRVQGSSLPFDIVATILSWLPVKSLLRFRCVCKEWRSLTYNPGFIKEQHSRARALGRLALISTRNRSPKILLYDFGDNGEVRNRAFNTSFGELNLFSTLSNPVNGLMCIKYCPRGMHGEASHYLLNPATRELARLPTSGNGPDGKHTTISLGVDGSTGGYKLVDLTYSNHHMDPCVCKVLELGTQEWREVGGAPCMMLASRQLVHLNGAIHWISQRPLNANDDSFERRIETFNLEDEKFQSIPTPPECETGDGQDNLVVWEGLLCIVKVPDMFELGATSVRIWRLEDYATCRWREAHCGELPSNAPMDGHLFVVGIRGHEMMLMLYRTCAPGSIGYYDLRTRSFRELYTGDQPKGLQFLTESLVSPRYFAGNLTLQ